MEELRGAAAVEMSTTADIGNKAAGGYQERRSRDYGQDAAAEDGKKDAVRVPRKARRGTEAKNVAAERKMERGMRRRRRLSRIQPVI